MRYLMGRYGVSERRACRTAKFWPSSFRYESRRDPLTALRQRMRELAQTRVRFAYRRLCVLLLREGWDVGKERFYRVYQRSTVPADRPSGGSSFPEQRRWLSLVAFHLSSAPAAPP